LRILLAVLALLVLTAATRARLSQYENVAAPTGMMAKATKLAECRFERLIQFPPAIVLVREPAYCPECVREESPVDAGAVLFPRVSSPLRT